RLSEPIVPQRPDERGRAESVKSSRPETIAASGTLCPVDAPNARREQRHSWHQVGTPLASGFLGADPRIVGERVADAGKRDRARADDGAFREQPVQRPIVVSQDSRL